MQYITLKRSILMGTLWNLNLNSVEDIGFQISVANVSDLLLILANGSSNLQIAMSPPAISQEFLPLFEGQRKIFFAWTETLLSLCFSFLLLNGLSSVIESLSSLFKVINVQSCLARNHWAAKINMEEMSSVRLKRCFPDM